MATIRFSREAHVGIITIDRPEKKNALTYPMLTELGAAFDEAEEDESVRCIVLTGVPGAFCAGTDLSNLDETPVDERGRGGLGGHAFLDAAKPIVAAIDGPAVGMGVEFATMCDVRVASERARFGWVFVHRGLVPDIGAGTWLLPRLVGPAHAARLLFGGEIISARDAADLGFVSELVGDADPLERAVDIARSFTVGSPFAVRETRRLLYDGIGRSWGDHVAENRQALARCFDSDDHREGVAAFLERRPPEFTGH